MYKICAVSSVNTFSIRQLYVKATYLVSEPFVV